MKVVEETQDEIDNSNDNEEVKEQEESKSEEAVEEEELIEIPEHLQEIVKREGRRRAKPFEQRIRRVDEYARKRRELVACERGRRWMP